MAKKTPMNYYRKDIQKFRSIGREEEKRLVKEIAGNIAVITDKQSDDRKAVEATEKMLSLQDTIVIGNLECGLKIAERYLWGGVPREDLVQEANEGMLNAVKRYGRNKCGVRFAYYTCLSLGTRMLKLIANQGGFFKISYKDLVTVLKMDELVREADARGEPRPSAYELAKMIEVERATRQANRKNKPAPTVDDIAYNLKNRETRIEEMLSMPVVVYPSSIEENAFGFGYQNQCALRQETPLDTALQEERVNMLYKAIQTLPPRKQTIIKMRFGIGYEKERTLEEIGNELGLTKERIRQIENGALRELRQELRQYMRD